MKEKNDIIGELILYDKNYNPPSDYKPPKKVKILYIKKINNIFGGKYYGQHEHKCKRTRQNTGNDVP